MDYTYLHTFLSTIIASLTNPPTFVKGIFEEVAQTMQLISNDKIERFPVIALIYNDNSPKFKENYNTNTLDVEFDLSIATETSERYTFEERYSINFEVLHQIRKQLFNKINNSNLSIMPQQGNYDYTYVELPYILAVGQNKVDAIQLNGIKIQLTKKTC